MDDDAKSRRKRREARAKREEDNAARAREAESRRLREIEFRLSLDRSMGEFSATPADSVALREGAARAVGGAPLDAESAPWLASYVRSFHAVGWLASMVADWLVQSGFGAQALEAAAESGSATLCSEILGTARALGLAPSRAEALRLWARTGGPMEVGSALLSGMEGPVDAVALRRCAADGDRARLALLLERADPSGAADAASASAALGDFEGLSMALAVARADPGAFGPAGQARGALARAAGSGSLACFEALAPFFDLGSEAPRALLEASCPRDPKSLREGEGRAEICRRLAVRADSPAKLDALLRAAHCGSAGCARVLLEHLPRDGLAAEDLSREPRAVQALLEASSGVDAPGRDYSGCVSALAPRFARFDVSRALARAVERGAEGPLRALLALAPRPRGALPRALAPLAIFSGSARAAADLLRRAAGSDARDAARICAVLVEFGADPRLRSSGLWGRSALDVARARPGSPCFGALLAAAEAREIAGSARAPAHPASERGAREAPDSPREEARSARPRL